MTQLDDEPIYQPDEHTAVILHASGISAQLDSIQDAVKRFDEEMLAAAATAVPDGPTIDTLLAAIDGIPFRIDIARPELVTETALGRILDALKLIDSELQSYIATGNIVHLATSLNTGIQNLYQVLGHCFGYWQLSKDPSRAGKIKRLSLRLGIPNVGSQSMAYPVLVTR